MVHLSSSLFSLCLLSLLLVSSVHALSGNFQEEFNLSPDKPYYALPICGKLSGSASNWFCYETLMTFTVSSDNPNIRTVFVNLNDYKNWANGNSDHSLESFLSSVSIDTAHSCLDSNSCSQDWFSASGNDKVVLILGSTSAKGGIAGSWKQLAGPNTKGFYERLEWDWGENQVDHVINLCDPSLSEPSPVTTSDCASLMTRWSVYMDQAQPISVIWTDAAGIADYRRTGQLPNDYNPTASHLFDVEQQTAGNGVNGNWFVGNTKSSVMLVYRDPSSTVKTHTVVGLEVADFSSES